jgi:hypothetical protein
MSSCQYGEDVGMPEHRCAVRCAYAPDNAHVICCNDAVMHVHLGTEEQAQGKLEELAKADYDRNHWYWEGVARHYGNNASPYSYYRNRCYWHIHTTGVST